MKAIIIILILFTPFLQFAECDTYIDICYVDIPNIYKIGNCSFSPIVIFDVDKNGIPQNMNLIAGGRFVFADKLFACMKKWRIPSLIEKKRIAAVWHWKHARGWTSLKISADGYCQTIKIMNESTE